MQIETMDQTLDDSRKINPPDVDLSTLVINLLKGVLYKETDESTWGALI